MDDKNIYTCSGVERCMLNEYFYDDGVERLHPKGAFQNLCLSHGLHRAGGNTNLKVCLRDKDLENCVVKWKKVYSI